MTSATIKQALTAETEAIDFDPAMRIAYPRINFIPNNNETYLEIRHFPNTNINPTWGRDKTMQGIWQVSVVVNGDQYGDIPPTEIASIIAEHFHKNKRIACDGSFIKIYQHPTVLTPVDEPSKTIYPVSIPYQLLKRE